MIQFEHLTIHNFNSYGHAEFDLRNKGFCFVTGQNNYKKDCSSSNGSGKSTFLNAISVCLTGESMNGLKTGFKNLLIEEDLCYITLRFKYEKDSYEITRQFNPKSDLKIIKNSEDISGKGITESKKILSEVLPDLTKDLLASTILIGQGMPNRLTLNSPSGRKDLLESLTKTDFMIEDTKRRLEMRSSQVSSKLREVQDSLLVKNTKLNSTTAQIENLTNEVNSMVKPDESELNKLKDQFKEIENVTNDLTKEMSENEAKLKTESENYIQLLNQKSEAERKLTEEFNSRTTSLKEKRISLNSEIHNLQHKINQINSMSDTCPTCKQKLLNFTRPSTKEDQDKLNDFQKQLEETELSIKNFDEKFKTFKQQIEDQFSNDLRTSKENKTSIENAILKLKLSLQESNTKKSTLQTSIISLDKDIKNFEQNLNSKKKLIEDTKKEKINLTNEITKLTEHKTELEQRQMVLKKMDSLAKRDFRGLLLQNIIKYLNTKSKEFCKIVFDTDEIEIYLDGNNLDVSYCGKLVEGLSGGERTKVDLIVQLALRNLLINYFGMSSNLLALDEVTDYLDKTSCDNIMKLIQSELMNVESVYIISHRQNELNLPIDSYLNIVKDSAGISSVC